MTTTTTAQISSETIPITSDRVMPSLAAWWRDFLERVEWRCPDITIDHTDRTHRIAKVRMGPDRPAPCLPWSSCGPLVDERSPMQEFLL